MSKRMVTMTEGSIEKRVIQFAIPILLSNLLQQMYNTLDTIVVGRFVGSTALAAVGSTTALVNLVIGFYIGLSTGAGVVVAPQIRSYRDGHFPGFGGDHRHRRRCGSSPLPSLDGYAGGRYGLGCVLPADHVRRCYLHDLI